ncbi:MAG: zf-HC2 domain-containing protein [Candidatus Eremiobacteraeota bacterium]|nr:zf-HC2 domain-containing protein [Candidatus Eremiobacteraeota bacterium]
MFERGEHAGEAAELYALGQLSPQEREQFDRHVRECAQCAARAGEAEATVLRLIEADAANDATPLRAPWRPARKRRYAAWMTAVAAALVLALLPWGWYFWGPRAAAPPEQLAATAMLNGHFLHAALVPAAAGAPRAKVIYARDGGWYYVLVDATPRTLDVVLIAAGTRTRVASVAAGETTRGAFVREGRRYDAIELDEDGRKVASAKLIYPR